MVHRTFYARCIMHDDSVLLFLDLVLARVGGLKLLQEVGLVGESLVELGFLFDELVVED